MTTKPKPRPAIANADVPSETVVTGLPSAGEGASGQAFVRDLVGHQAGEGAGSDDEDEAAPDNPNAQAKGTGAR